MHQELGNLSAAVAALLANGTGRASLGVMAAAHRTLLQDSAAAHACFGPLKHVPVSLSLEGLFVEQRWVLGLLEALPRLTRLELRWGARADPGAVAVPLATTPATTRTYPPHTSHSHTQCF